MLPRDMARAIRSNLADAKGGILAFLPGEAEIRRTEEALLGSPLPDDVRVMPLYGAMALADQDAVIRPAGDGRRKIVLAGSQRKVAPSGVGSAFQFSSPSWQLA